MAATTPEQFASGIKTGQEPNGMKLVASHFLIDS
jgi:hypothetical protein